MKPTFTNQQLPEPFDKSSGPTLDIHTIWHTLQGEGPHAGKPAIFLRLAGCNLQCPWCDTEYTLGRRQFTVKAIARSIITLGERHPQTQLLVITGGEPTRQNLDGLVAELGRYFHIQIESNGVLAPSPRILNLIENALVDYVVSPKTHKIANETSYATCFKYVIDANSIDPEDGLPIKALGHSVKDRVARPPEDFDRADIYINPMDSGDPEQNQRNLIACRDSALKHGYRLGVQLHKIVGVA